MRIPRTPLTRAAAAKDAFATVDKSGDGKVSMPEAKKALEAAFPKLGKYVAKAFLASDDDGSFYLDREEYEAVQRFSVEDWGKLRVALAWAQDPGG